MRRRCWEGGCEGDGMRTAVGGAWVAGRPAFHPHLLSRDAPFWCSAEAHLVRGRCSARSVGPAARSLPSFSAPRTETARGPAQPARLGPSAAEGYTGEQIISTSP